MIGIYVHFPFCRVHCSYCAFAVMTDHSRQDAYLAALVSEITSRSNGERVDTVYFGGGTPSRTPPAHLKTIAQLLRARFAIADNAELTIEANPEDVSEETIRVWR